jgi:hypothetical protein
MHKKVACIVNMGTRLTTGKAGQREIISCLVVTVVSGSWLVLASLWQHACRRRRRRRYKIGATRPPPAGGFEHERQRGRRWMDRMHVLVAYIRGSDVHATAGRDRARCR